MLNEDNFSEWQKMMDLARFGQVTEDTSGSNILSSDVSEGRVFYPVAFYLSDTSGAANTVSLDKVEEDDTTTSVVPNYNLAASESVFLQADEFGVVFPRLEGGTNLQVTAGSNGVEATMFYIPNEV